MWTYTLPNITSWRGMQKKLTNTTTTVLIPYSCHYYAVSKHARGNYWNETRFAAWQEGLQKFWVVLGTTRDKSMLLLPDPSDCNPDLQRSLWKTTNASSGHAGVWCNKWGGHHPATPHTHTRTHHKHSQQMCCKITSEWGYKSSKSSRTDTLKELTLVRHFTLFCLLLLPHAATVAAVKTYPNGAD